MPIKDLYKALILTSVIFAVALSAYIFLFKDIKSRNEQAAILVVETQIESVREAKLKALKANVALTEDVRKELEFYIPESESSVSLIEKIEEMGSIAGVGVSIQRVGIEHHPDKRFEWLSFSVSINGSWNQVMRYIALIETLPFPAPIHSLFIERSLGEEGIDWQARIVFKILKKEQ